MLKEKLQKAVAELKKTFSNVVVKPGASEGEVDIPLDLQSRSNSDAQRLQALEILKTNGLKAHGFVASQQCSKIFLRNIQVLATINHQPATDSGAAQ
jgi:hypothetical protein